MLATTNRIVGFVALCGVLLLSCRTEAGDWPSYRHDAARGGYTKERLALPLQEVWRRTSRVAPHAALSPPAKQDFFNRRFDLHPQDTFDQASQPVAAGGKVFYGSSVTDTLACVDAATGATQWTVITEGPIRTPPLVAKDKVIVGSDDGVVYCCDTATGAIQWTYRAGPEDQRLPGNERMISRWPVRGSPVADDGVVYFTAGVFPTAGVYLCAVEVESGRPLWSQKIDIPARGFLALSATRIYVPTGRTGFQVFRKSDGVPDGGVAGGTAFALLVNEQLVTGPNETGNTIGIDPQVRDKIASVRGLQLVVHDNEFFISSEAGLAAVDAQRQLKWQLADVAVASLIMASDQIIIGGENRVAIHNARDGQLLWEQAINGWVRGLAVADGQLLVSTDNGSLYAFGESESLEPIIIDEPPLSGTRTESGLPRQLLQEISEQKGYCLVVGCGEGELLQKLAAASDMQIIGVDRDRANVLAARKRLVEAGLYGYRVVVHQVKEAPLPYQPRTMNVVVQAEAFSGARKPVYTSEQLQRFVRPYGGKLVVMAPATSTALVDEWAGGDDWHSLENEDFAIRVWERGTPEGAGDWSHQFADAGNTANSGDTQITGPFDVQWFGPPGAERMIDRHNRGSAPLFHKGLLIIPGNEFISAVDAYNGTILWQREIPDSLRIAISKDCSHIALGDDALYLAAGKECLVLDVTTGKTLSSQHIDEFDDKLARRWGYVAIDDGVLFGSAMKDDTISRTLSPDSWTLGYLDNGRLMTSDQLYAIDSKLGERLWSYRPTGGAVLNTTIGATNGHVYFVRSENPEVTDNPTGRLPLAELTKQGTTLVALDARTGEYAWQRPVDLSQLQHSLFLSISQGVVLLTGSKNVGSVMRYDLHAFDAATGEPLWSETPNVDHPVGGSHGEQDQHPAIVGQTIYTKTFALDLRTGQKVRDWGIPGGGCGTLSACATGVFHRSGNPAMTELAGGTTASLTRVTRPGCWINMLPAGGLILAPEGSSGCTCGYGLQTSLALSPAECPPPTIQLTADSRRDGFGLAPTDDSFAPQVTCELACDDPDATIHFTTDGTWPSPSASVYSEPLTFNETTIVRARAYRSSGATSSVVERTFTKSDSPRIATPSQPFVVDVKVEIERPFGRSDIRYTTDDTRPTANSNVYREPIVLLESATVRASLFDGAKRLGPDVEANFDKVAGLTPVDRDGLVAGLQHDYYEGEGWTKLPNFAALTPVKSGTTDNITLAPAQRRDGFAFVYRGFIKIPRDGFYEFHLRSDDGSRFSIGDEIVIDHDGQHDGRGAKTVRIALAAGLHPFELSYFDAGLDESLFLYFEGPSVPRQLIPANALFHERVSDVSLTTPPPE